MRRVDHARAGLLSVTRGDIKPRAFLFARAHSAIFPRPRARSRRGERWHRRPHPVKCCTVPQFLLWKGTWRTHAGTVPIHRVKTPPASRSRISFKTRKNPHSTTSTTSRGCRKPKSAKAKTSPRGAPPKTPASRSCGTRNPRLPSKRRAPPPLTLAPRPLPRKHPSPRTSAPKSRAFAPSACS